VVLATALVGAAGYGLAYRPAPTVLKVQPPPPTPLPTGTRTAAPACFHIVGAVEAPGVYTLPPGSRVQDAIEVAGGPTSDADLDRLNLAALLQDQDQIFVPRRNLPTIEDSPQSEQHGEHPPLLNINSADSETLQTLPGIGPVLADRIIAYREEHGLFATVDDLKSVKGIGDKTLDELRPLITAGP
jgi:competence protein ComEA